MWPTILVIDHGTELRPSQPFPAFSKGGSVLLYQVDTVSGQKVPLKYEVTAVLFDVYDIKQYVHLSMKSDDEH